MQLQPERDLQYLHEVIFLCVISKTKDDRLLEGLRIPHHPTAMCEEKKEQSPNFMNYTKSLSLQKLLL